jgi:putative phosphoesterase
MVERQRSDRLRESQDQDIRSNRPRTAKRVAALYDIHGNFPAIEAVLEDIRRVAVDAVVVGGDIFPGPMPRESLRCLLEFEVRITFVLGNGDREVLAQLRRADPDAVPEAFREVVCWTAQQLDPEHEPLIASWTQSVRFDISGLGEVLFCHATPRSDTELFTRLSPANRLVTIFERVDTPVVVCGHTHMQYDRTVGTVRVLNAGSVGMPFGEPGAYWLLLGPDVEFRHTRYDLSKAAERIRATRYPQAHEFAAHNVLEPPTESEMLEKFSQAERGRT